MCFVTDSNQCQETKGTLEDIEKKRIFLTFHSLLQPIAISVVPDIYSVDTMEGKHKARLGSLHACALCTKGLACKFMQIQKCTSTRLHRIPFEELVSCTWSTVCPSTDPLFHGLALN